MAVFPANSQIHEYSLTLFPSLRKICCALSILLAGILCTVTPSIAQNLTTKNKKAITYYKEGDNFRVRRQYAQAIQLFEEAVKKDKNFAEAWFMLGVTHQTTGNFTQSIAAFKNALTLFPEERTPYIIYLQLGRLHFQISQLEEAGKYIDGFLDRERVDQRLIGQANKLKRDITFTLNYVDPGYEVKVEYLREPLNLFDKQYFPVLTADQKTIFFTKMERDGDEDIWYATRDSIDGNWNQPTSLSKNINSRANEGTCTVSADGRTMVFTSCQGRPGLGSCDLYVTRKVGEEWSFPENLGPAVNSPSWDSQPSLSADGRTIYFVSTRLGSLGGRDIWKTTYDDRLEKWTKPKNLGEPVNTEFDEVSPYIHPNNQVLYFSSEGHPGFGGMDLFYTELRMGGEWKEPINLGKPINSVEDQVSMFITADESFAYYSWEMQGGYGRDSKLVTFKIPEELKIKKRVNYVYGEVRDAETKAPLNAHLELFSLSAQERIFRIESDSITGEYLMVLAQSDSFSLYVEKQGYLFQQVEFSADFEKQEEPERRIVYLEKIEKGKSVVLRNIYFDIDSYTLKEESIPELDIVRRYLVDQPELSIVISGHTDNTGDRNYNKNLSTKRAEAVYRYLLENGIDESRLQFRGYGDSKPLKPNDSDLNRSQNRRIEFEIL